VLNPVQTCTRVNGVKWQRRSSARSAWHWEPSFMPVPGPSLAYGNCTTMARYELCGWQAARTQFLQRTWTVSKQGGAFIAFIASATRGLSCDSSHNLRRLMHVWRYFPSASGVLHLCVDEVHTAVRSAARLAHDARQFQGGGYK
jgi:hypothetical protein